MPKTLQEYFVERGLHCTYNRVIGLLVEPGVVIGSAKEPIGVIIAPRVAGKSQWALVQYLGPAAGSSVYLDNNVEDSYVWE